MEPLVKQTTKKEQQLARSSIQFLQETSRKVAGKAGDSVKIKFGEKEEFLKIPKKAFLLLSGIIENMADGKSVMLLPTEEQLSTQQAADLLNVSRPHLVRLLEEGKIPFEKVGTHRRVEPKAIVAYEKTMKKRKADKLSFLSKQAQDLHLGY